MRTFDCEILVLGAGPAGLSAALAAARCGKSVIVLTTTRVQAGKSGAMARRFHCLRAPYACARLWRNSQPLRCLTARG